MNDGCYRYTRAPISFCNRGHHFVSKIMRLIMEVDDTLMQAPNEEELFDKFKALLKCCRLHNIRLACRKLQFRLIVIFAGYQIGGNNSYRPEKKKIDALVEICPPTNLRELCSYMEVVNCLRRFIPDLSQNLIHMRELLKKEAKWNWSPETGGI